MNDVPPYRETTDALGELLIRSVAGSPSAAEQTELARRFSAQAPDAVLQKAEENQVACLAGDGLRRAGCPLPATWHQRLEDNDARVQARIETLDTLFQHFQAHGIQGAVIEGGGVLLGTDLSTAAFCAGDFDVLVDERAWSDAEALLKAMGFAPKDRRGRPTRRVEFGRIRSDGSEEWIELGADPFDRMWTPLHYRPQHSRWLTRTVSSRKSSTIRVLCPTDALALVAMHTSTHSYVRAPGLRLHMDVDRLSKDTAIEWPEFRREVEAMEICSRAFVSLVMARDLLQARIDADCLRALAPPAWRWQAMRRILESAGVLCTDRSKLPRGQAVLLDALVYDGALPQWALRTLWPSADWMREHFDRSGAHDGSTWALHGRRARALVTRWHPE